MTVHLWEGTAHPRSNIEARATFAKDIYNKDSLFSPRIFVPILTYCNNWRKLYFLHFAQKGFHRQHVTVLMYSPMDQKVVPKLSPVVTKCPIYEASCIWLSIIWTGSVIIVAAL